MKKVPKRRGDQSADELRDEYQFDYKTAKPNRFASRSDDDKVVVVLDPDISKVFKSTEAVNKVLRALIATMPVPAKPQRRTKPTAPKP